MTMCCITLTIRDWLLWHFGVGLITASMAAATGGGLPAFSAVLGGTLWVAGVGLAVLIATH